MRALGLTSVIAATVMAASPNGAALAQDATASPSNSSCNSTAIAGNRAPVASLRVTPSRLGATAARTVTVTTTATDPDGDDLTYSYTYSGGRMNGQGPTGVWNLSGVQPGTYTISVFIQDGKGCWASPGTSILIED